MDRQTKREREKSKKHSHLHRSLAEITRELRNSETEILRKTQAQESTKTVTTITLR